MLRPVWPTESVCLAWAVYAPSASSGEASTEYEPPALCRRQRLQELAAGGIALVDVNGDGVTVALRVARGPR